MSGFFGFTGKEDILGEVGSAGIFFGFELFELGAEFLDTLEVVGNFFGAFFAGNEAVFFGEVGFGGGVVVRAVVPAFFCGREF